MKGQTEAGREFAGKGEVGVGFGAAQAVVQMGGVEDEAEFTASRGKGTEEGHRVRATGEAHGHAQTGLEEHRVEGQTGHFGRGFAHERMIARETSYQLSAWVCSS